MSAHLFVNKNRRLSVVQGCIVTEIPLNMRDAAHLLAIIGEAEFDITASEQTQLTGRALRRLFNAVTRVTIANRHELEHRDDPRMRLHNIADRKIYQRRTTP